MSFDIVSYAAGLTGTVKTFVIGLLILFAVGALIVLLKKYGVTKIKVGGKLIVKFNMKEYCYTCGS